MLTEEQEDQLASRIRDVGVACHNIVDQASMIRPLEFMVATEIEEGKRVLRAELEQRGMSARFDEFCNERLGWWANKPFIVFQRPGVDPSMLLDPTTNGTAALMPSIRYKAAPWRGGALRPLFGAHQVASALDLLLSPTLNPEKLLEELRRVKVAFEREEGAVKVAAFQGRRASVTEAELSRRHEAWSVRPPVARALIRLATQPDQNANAPMLRALAHAIEQEAEHDRVHAVTVMRVGGHVPVPLPADDWDQKPLIAEISDASTITDASKGS